VSTFPWQFDELVHSGVDFADPDEVEAYDQRQQRDPEVERRLLRQLGVTGASALLEFGPGTGVLTLEAAKLCRKVYAVDVSPAMLAYIERRAQYLGWDNLTLVNAGFLSYHHEGELVDVVVSQFALHHLPDFWKVQALVRIAEVLKPGGTFYLHDVVFSFESQESARRIEAWFDAYASGTGDGWSRSDFEMHVRQEYSTYSWLLEAMLVQAGFEIVQAEYDALKVYGAYTCVKVEGTTS
jgi:ubiquinone/menaquinone biosynthesis C-methylase UbiE